MSVALTEEARNQPLSPGRTLTEFWSNAPQPTPAPRAEEQVTPLTAIPRAHLTKAEIKRQQWERERGAFFSPWPLYSVGSKCVGRQMLVAHVVQFLWDIIILAICS